MLICKRARILVSSIILTLFSAPAVAEPVSMLEEEQALAEIYGNPDMVSIATGSRQSVNKAPAVASVITADEIKAMGATDLDEVLETVPGLHVLRSFVGYNPIYSIRGIASEFNAQVLVLINGIPLTNSYHGDRGSIWGGMPVQGIARIEVIRGPGSAIYGADAASGVINIITKSKQDIDGLEIGGRAGSFDSYDGWLLNGGEWAGFDIAATVEYHETDGQRRIVDSDLQTSLDQIFGTNASLAPGPVNLTRENFDARLDVARGDFRLRAGIQRRDNFGNAVGVAQALDPHGRYASDRYNADLTYHDADFTENWEVMVQLSHLESYNEDNRSNLVLLPPGTRLPIGPDGNLDFSSANLVTFTNGLIGNPEVFERHSRINGSAFYRGFDRHTVRLGLGFNYDDLYETRESKNFGLDPKTGQPIPLLPGQPVVDVSGTPYSFLPTASREDYFFFLQDEWRFLPDWQLTAGLRYDAYSDFGDTVNPRLALVWETRYDLTSKLLYGSAFRAPTFAEMYAANNPVLQGNAHLKPETMDTLELAFDYRPRDQWRLGFNLFYYWWSDIIRYVPDAGATTITAQNAGRQQGYGGELQAEWQAYETLKLSGNYAYQRSTDQILNHDAGDAPHHQLYLRADWRFLPNWQVTPQINCVLDRDRVAGDLRPAVADYVGVDLTIRRNNVAEHWDVAFSVRNLFNADIREPSPFGAASAPIPNDFPQAGRSVFGEIRFRY